MLGGLCTDHNYLARRPAPADPNDLSGHDVIGYGGALAGLPAAKWLNEHAANAKIVLHSSDSAGMLDAAVAGVGLAVLPCYLGDAEASLTRLTPSVLASRNVSLVYRREARLSEAVRLVIRFVVTTMQAHAEELSGTKVSR